MDEMGTRSLTNRYETSRRCKIAVTFDTSVKYFQFNYLSKQVGIPMLHTKKN